jgi:hypothetical protein
MNGTLKAISVALSILLALGALGTAFVKVFVAPVEARCEVICLQLDEHKHDGDHHPSREWIEAHFQRVQESLDRIEKRLK